MIPAKRAQRARNRIGRSYDFAQTYTEAIATQRKRAGRRWGNRGNTSRAKSDTPDGILGRPRYKYVSVGYSLYIIKPDNLFARAPYLYCSVPGEPMAKIPKTRIDLLET